MSDLFDRYLRPGQRSVQAPAQEATSGRPVASAIGRDGYILNFPRGGYQYEAFSAPAQHQPHYLLIARKKNGHIAPSYTLLDEIDFDPGGTWVLLVFSHVVVNLKGRNLHPLVAPLLDKRVEMIEEFDSASHRMLEEDKPIVLQVETYTRTGKRGGDGEERTYQE